MLFSIKHIKPNIYLNKTVLGLLYSNKSGNDDYIFCLEKAI